MNLPCLRRAAFALACLAALPAHAGELIVSAAASLTQAFKEIGPAFEKAVPGTTVTYNFAGSGALLQQIDNGAPVDVFASADQETMDKAADRGLVAAPSQRHFAANRLVLVQPRNADAIAGLSVLSRKSQAAPSLLDPRGGRAGRSPALLALASESIRRIGIGNPASVPVGRYTRHALQAEGLWEALSAKFIVADSVRQVLDYVARGEVDAGFVYATDARLAKEKVAVVAAVATQDPLRYPIAIVKASRQPAAAAAFVAYVTGPAGQAVLARHGFEAP